MNEWNLTSACLAFLFLRLLASLLTSVVFIAMNFGIPSVAAPSKHASKYIDKDQFSRSISLSFWYKYTSLSPLQSTTSTLSVTHSHSDCMPLSPVPSLSLHPCQTIRLPRQLRRRCLLLPAPARQRASVASHAGHLPQRVPLRRAGERLGSAGVWEGGTLTYTHTHRQASRREHRQDGRQEHTHLCTRIHAGKQAGRQVDTQEGWREEAGRKTGFQACWRVIPQAVELSGRLKVLGEEASFRCEKSCRNLV